MGLFGKLFGKKQQENTPPPQDDRIYWESPFGRFLFEKCDCGYGGEVQWYEDDGAEKIDIYFDTDTPETLDAGSCYARLEQLLLNKLQTDIEVKQAAARYFMARPDMVDEKYPTEESQMLDMEIDGIYVYRNGNTEISLEAHGVYAGEINVIYRADGSKGIRYHSYDDEQSHTDTL